jgi:hypothetical protein
MNAWLWFPLAGLFVALVFSGAKAIVDWVSDRRWARMMRDQDRRNLRYEAWMAVTRLGRGE